MLNIIITGRVFDKNRLIGYKAWKIDNNLESFIIEKDKVTILFRENTVVNCCFDTKANTVKSKISIPISEYPKYNRSLNLYDKNRYTDSNIIAIALNRHVEDIRILVCGALIYGAVTDPLSTKALKHAEMYYEEIRKRSTDVKTIARNTGFEESEIHRIKNYIFMESHKLDDGYRRFDASFEIASSWQRLIENRIEKHDITLLKHELLEIRLTEQGIDQRPAHNYAENQFNYGKESNEYYARLKEYNKRR